MPYLDEYYGQGQETAPADTGQVSAGELRAMLAARQGPEALQREVVAAQVPYTAGRVSWGEEPAWWQKGGYLKPQDLVPLAAMGGGLASAGLRAGARGLMSEAAQQIAKEALKDPAERIFQEHIAPAGRAALSAGQNFIGGPQGPMPGWLKAALGVGGIGGIIELAKWFGKEAPRRQ